MTKNIIINGFTILKSQIIAFKIVDHSDGAEITICTVGGSEFFQSFHLHNLEESKILIKQLNNLK
jgi:hypothetical protein